MRRLRRRLNHDRRGASSIDVSPRDGSEDVDGPTFKSDAAFSITAVCDLVRTCAGGVLSGAKSGRRGTLTTEGLGGGDSYGMEEVARLLEGIEDDVPWLPDNACLSAEGKVCVEPDAMAYGESI